MSINSVLALLFCYTFFLAKSLQLVSAQPFDYPTANLSTSWINSPSAPHSVQFTDGSLVRATLLRGSFGPKFASGFYCNGKCDSYLFAVFIVQTNSGSGIVQPSIGFPQVVWSANRNHPVKINATLQLSSDGNLVLQDADGSVAWSTNTRGKSVAGLNLTESGNLVLFNKRKAVVWQSFDHPTDALVPGQKLVEGQRLTASVSKTNWTDAGLYSLVVNNKGLFAYIQSNPPQAYYEKTVSGSETSKTPSYIKLVNGSLALYIHSAEPSEPSETIQIPQALSAQYMKLESDGHLRVYEWQSGWKVVADLLTGFYGECAYPLVCGKYSICSNGQCSCPGSSSIGARYFRQLVEKHPDLGCTEITPLSCSASKKQKLLDVPDVTYFTFNSNISNTNVESCKQACLSDCSCKAAVFRYGSDPSKGECFLPKEVFSLMDNDMEKTHYNSSAFLKVQNPR